MENQTNQTDQVPERIWKVIQDLLSRTTDNNCTAAEVEQAAVKVQELLLKYNLTLCDVQGRNTKRKFDNSYFEIGTLQKRHDSNWVAALVNVISRHNLCKAIYFGASKRMMVVGERHNIQIVLYLVDQLIPKINSACSRAWKEYSRMVDEKRNTFRRGFLMGCVAGIDSKLTDQRCQMEAENNSVMALIRVTGTELNTFVTGMFGTLKTNKKRGKLRKSSDSKALGYDAGKRMDINKGLDGPSSSGQIEG